MPAIRPPGPSPRDRLIRPSDLYLKRVGPVELLNGLEEQVVQCARSRIPRPAIRDHGHPPHGTCHFERSRDCAPVPASYDGNLPGNCNHGYATTDVATG